MSREREQEHQREVADRADTNPASLDLHLSAPSLLQKIPVALTSPIPPCPPARAWDRARCGQCIEGPPRRLCFDQEDVAKGLALWVQPMSAAGTLAQAARALPATSGVGGSCKGCGLGCEERGEHGHSGASGLGQPPLPTRPSSCFSAWLCC